MKKDAIKFIIVMMMSLFLVNIQRPVFSQVSVENIGNNLRDFDYKDPHFVIYTIVALVLTVIATICIAKFGRNIINFASSLRYFILIILFCIEIIIVQRLASSITFDSQANYFTFLGFALTLSTAINASIFSFFEYRNKTEQEKKEKRQLSTRQVISRWNDENMTKHKTKTDTFYITTKGKDLVEELTKSVDTETSVESIFNYFEDIYFQIKNREVNVTEIKSRLKEPFNDFFNKYELWLKHKKDNNYSDTVTHLCKLKMILNNEH